MYAGGAGNGAVGLATAAQGADDDVLVAAVRAGDDAAFEELYRRYRSRISAFVFGFVRDEGRSEDVTQEAFLSALRRMRETSSPIAFKPWIYEIARNAAIDLYRRTSRAEEVSINADSPLPPADRRRLVGSDALESTLQDKERFEHLRGALDELSEAHHRILILREFEGRTYREIGDRMDLTAPAVESTLFRARKRLKKEYAEIDTGRRCASMRSIIAQLAEGVDLPRERRKLERHALRCTSCRRRARELGVEPMRQAGDFSSRAAAFLPLPAVLRRRTGATSWGGVAAPVADGGGVLVGKAGALLAAAVLAGGGGATLGGHGPLAPDVLDRGAAPVEAPEKAPKRGAARSPNPTPQAGGTPARGGNRSASPREPRPATPRPGAGGAVPSAPPSVSPAPGSPAGPPLAGLPPVDAPPVEPPSVEPPPVQPPPVRPPPLEVPPPPDTGSLAPPPEAPSVPELHAASAEAIGGASAPAVPAPPEIPLP